MKADAEINTEKSGEFGICIEFNCPKCGDQITLYTSYSAYNICSCNHEWDFSLDVKAYSEKVKQ